MRKSRLLRIGINLQNRLDLSSLEISKDSYLPVKTKIRKKQLKKLYKACSKEPK